MIMATPSPPPSYPNALLATHVSVRYGHNTILHDVTAGPFQPGKMSALLGPNGSGKSTLMRAIAGLTPITGAAWVTLGGTPLSGMPLAKRTQHCLYLPQALPAPAQLPVLEALIAARHTGALPPSCLQEDDVEAAMNWLEKFEIAHLAMRNMSTLSGGQRQLVGLAQALSRNPKALLLDEPLSALDLHHQYAVMALLRRETTQHQLVSVLVLHDLNIALNMTDHVAVVHEGHLKAAGPPTDVLTPALLRDVYKVNAHIEQGSDGKYFVSVDGIS